MRTSERFGSRRGRSGGNRPTGAPARAMHVALLIFVSVTCAGCGLHLHNPQDQGRAARAVTTFEEVDFDGIINDARSNAEALTDAELEHAQRLTEVGTRIELQAIVADPSAWTPDEWTSYVGWAKLGRDTKLALGDVEDDVTRRRIAALRVLRDELRFEEVEFKDQVRFFRQEHPNSTLPTKLRGIPRNEVELAARLQNVAEQQAADYRAHVSEPAAILLRLRREIVLAEDAIQSAIASETEQTAYGELHAGINELEGSIKARADTLKTLGRRFEESRREFKAREKALAEQKQRAEAGGGGDSEEPADGLPDLALPDDGALVESAKALIEIAKQARDADIEVLSEQISSSLIVELMARLDAAADEDGSAAAAAGHALLGAISDSAIREEILGDGGVSINELLLELAAHRQNYEQACARNAFEVALLGVKRAQAQALSDKYGSWSRVDTRLRSLEQQGVDPGDNVAGFVFDEAIPLSQREEAILAMVAYTQAKIYAGRYEELLVEERALFREQQLNRSEIALRTWKDFVGAPLQEIAMYHEGGITSEEIAGLLNAAGLAAIAVGVN